MKKGIKFGLWIFSGVLLSILLLFEVASVMTLGITVLDAVLMVSLILAIFIWVNLLELRWGAR